MATSAASAVGVLATGLIGFKAALARFRRERAFDKRVEWYESTIKTLGAASRHLITFAKFHQLYGTDSKDKIVETTLRLLRFMDVYQEAELYATSESFAAFDPVMDAVRDLIVLTTPENLDPSSDRHLELLETMEAAAYVMGEAASNLIDDMRSELGLQSIKRNWTWGRNEKKKAARSELDDLLTSHEEHMWTPLDTEIIRRALSRSHHLLSPEERIKLATDLEEYAGILRTGRDVDLVESNQ